MQAGKSSCAMHTERASAGDSGTDSTSGGGDFVQPDRQVARARIAFSLAAIISLYIDPSAGACSIAGIRYDGLLAPSVWNAIAAADVRSRTVESVCREWFCGRCVNAR